MMEKLLEINPQSKTIISSGYVNESAMPNSKTMDLWQWYLNPMKSAKCWKRCIYP
jgi:hypothetical protein